MYSSRGLFCVLVTGTILSGNVLAADIAETPLFGKVSNVREDDVLNVRVKPHYRSRKIGELPPKAYIGIQECRNIKKSRWCRVYQLAQNSYSDTFHPGWVNARYLTVSNRGYVLIKGVADCDYALRCVDEKCEVLADYTTDPDNDIIALETRWVERQSLKGESRYGAMPAGMDGHCGMRRLMDAYLKAK